MWNLLHPDPSSHTTRSSNTTSSVDSSRPRLGMAQLLCPSTCGVLFSILFSHFIIGADQSSSFTPRGVPLSRAPLYDSGRDFSCLDGSKLIPFSFVNDDYCDCPDGSDEPGTSACSRGSFYCLNVGHISIHVPSSRVNDQICDCCDGGDEFESDVKCSNTCDELGRAAREEADRLNRLAKEGFQKRLEMSQKGKDLRREKEEDRARLEAELQLAEALKTQKTQAKEEAEAPEQEALNRYKELDEERKRKEEEAEKLKSSSESEEMFNLIDSDGDGVITIQELRVRQTFDRNKDGEVSEEEAMFFLNMETSMSREEFLKSGWIVMKPYFFMEQGMFLPPEKTQEEESTDAGQKEESTEPGVIYENETDDYDDEEEDGKQPEIDKETSAEEVHEEAVPDPEREEPKYDEETQAIIARADQARSELSETEKATRDLSSKLQEVNDALNLDFGDDERWAALHGQCYDFEDREYVYTLCPYKESTQRGKSGGGSVGLGKWGSWSGPETDKYSQMTYDHGQTCWNGPARSTKVSVTCGIENRIVGVSEPSRCEYTMDFISPAACLKPEVTTSHDEL